MHLREAAGVYLINPPRDLIFEILKHVIFEKFARMQVGGRVIVNLSILHGVEWCSDTGRDRLLCLSQPQQHCSALQNIKEGSERSYIINICC